MKRVKPSGYVEFFTEEKQVEFKFREASSHFQMNCKAGSFKRKSKQNNIKQR